MTEVCPVLVCGFGRCGTSLLMQMLQAGGYPVIGEWPAFEPESVGILREMYTVMIAARGHAVKILDPQRSVWPVSFDAKVIWLDRNYKEQAKSQIKMVRAFSGIDISPNAWRGLARSLQSDRAVAMQLFSKSPLLSLRFEKVLAAPFAIANTIARFVGASLNVTKMAECVVSRTDKCLPDMSLEFRLVDEAERRIVGQA